MKMFRSEFDSAWEYVQFRAGELQGLSIGYRRFKPKHWPGAWNVKVHSSKGHLNFEGFGDTLEEACEAAARDEQEKLET